MDVSEVLAKTRQGDRASSDELIRRFYPAVQKRVHRELDLDVRKRHPWVAQLFSTGDIVHDVFISVLHGIDSFSGSERDFERYLTKVVKHRLVDLIRYHEASRRDARRASCDNDRSPDNLASADTSPTGAAQRREENECVEDALSTMSEKDQSLIRMRMKHGVSYRSIAEKLGLPSEDAARKATRAAEARLLAALRNRGLK